METHTESQPEEIDPGAVELVQEESAIQDAEEKNPQRKILTYVAVSMGFGIIPVPILDIAAVTAVQMEMLRQLSRLYKVDWSDVSGRYFITSQAGVTLARLAAGAIKTLPGVGTVIGAAAQAMLAGATTFAVGQVFLVHFGENKGTWANFNPRDYKEFYKEMFRKGRKVAEEVGEEEAQKQEEEQQEEETIVLRAESMENVRTRTFLEKSSEGFVEFYQVQVDRIRNWGKEEVEIEALPEDLNVDPADIEAEIAEEAEPNFLGKASDRLSGYYQQWVEMDESLLEKGADKLKDLYDLSLGRGVNWVANLRKKEEPAEHIDPPQQEGETINIEIQTEDTSSQDTSS